LLAFQEDLMARPRMLEENIVVSVRMEKRMYEMLHDLASLESLNSGKKVTLQELFRNALNFVYSDNERLRESFRRSRSHITKKFNT
jgi:hypothetical protein